MSTATTETAKLLSTVFVERAVEAAGFATGLFSVVSIWALLGERFTSFDLNRAYRRV